MSFPEEFPTYPTKNQFFYFISYASSIPENEGSMLMITDQPTSGSRWNPTADEVTILKELYRGGMRTPTSEQIQQISS